MLSEKQQQKNTHADNFSINCQGLCVILHIFKPQRYLKRVGATSLAYGLYNFTKFMQTMEVATYQRKNRQADNRIVCFNIFLRLIGKHYPV